jgi:hypothetical protein
MITINTILFLMVLIVFYSYIGYGLLVWLIVSYKKLKTGRWNYRK